MSFHSNNMNGAHSTRHRGKFLMSLYNNMNCKLTALGTGVGRRQGGKDGVHPVTGQPLSKLQQLAFTSLM